MSGSNQPRFKITGKDDAPNVTPLRPIKAEETPAPVDPKQGCVLDMIPMRLDPARFSSPVVTELMGPALDIQNQIPVVDDILKDAARRAEAGDQVTLSARQWELLRETHERLALTLAELAEGAFALEWSAALNGMVLLHLMTHPTKEDAEKATETLTNMIGEMQIFAKKQQEGNNGSH